MKEHTEVTPTEARQARKAPMVRRVLIFSTLAAIVLMMAIAYIVMEQG